MAFNNSLIAYKGISALTANKSDSKTTYDEKSISLVAVLNHYFFAPTSSFTTFAIHVKLNYGVEYLNITLEIQRAIRNIFSTHKTAQI